MRKFETGAVRDDETEKADYIETISWTALHRFAKYMTGCKAKYGSGNFKKGIPTASYERSASRHWSQYLRNKYENGNDEPEVDHLAAVIFNVFGVIHEEEQKKLRK